jgi:type II secretion system protein F
MATFSYKAKDQKGELIQGTMDADNQPAVVSRLQTMGYFPILISAEASGRRESFQISKLLGRRIRTSDIATLNRQLADLLSAGVPLVKSLSIIVNQTANPQLRTIINDVNSDVQGGVTLAHALAKHPKVFSKLFCAMVRAGEAGGILDAVLQRLADFAESEEELRSKVKASLAYPVIMVFAGGAAVTILLTVVIPKIVKIFAELNQTLPVPTQILIGTTNFITSNILFLLFGIVVVAFGLWNFARSTEGKLFFHRVQLRIPLVGAIILKREISRFARTLGSLLHNGVPILSALEITEEVMTNIYVRDEVAKISEQIKQGSAVAAPLRDSTIFPPVVVNMISIGEETGKLDEVLIKIAQSNETEVDRLLKTLTSLIEPIIILIMGCVVAFIVISMLLPIFNLNPAV